MKTEILTNILSLIAGVTAGLSSGMGFWPCYKQPKNLQVQTLLAAIAIGCMISVFLILT